MHSIYFATGGNYQVSLYAMKAAINYIQYGLTAMQDTLRLIEQLQAQWAQVSLGLGPPSIHSGSIFDAWA